MKHLIKIESTAHGVLGVRHGGKDQQYCEAGKKVVLKCQPDAGWGLKEAHIITKKEIVPIEGGEFVMPNEPITIGGTFKKFVLNDWTGDVTAEIVMPNHLILQDVSTSKNYEVFVDKGLLELKPYN